ncbi:THUMP domain-containing class I SAM-dependent RNA methyltransferase [Bordetella sp. H567]|uniref:THUMP domain-containing class I SAM-dependent RNA methyltransferase n=1 Tax=Bordetella sp. H567 TaxID=1697043 RepID=UPI0009F653F5|nr:THUMP domain-containing protein [Bordetella sp. H567]
MSADDSERPRKTLTLAKRPRDTAPAADPGKRQRSGARARLVALQEKQREKARTDPTPAAPPRQRDATKDKPDRRTQSAHDAASAPSRRPPHAADAAPRQRRPGKPADAPRPPREAHTEDDGRGARHPRDARGTTSAAGTQATSRNSPEASRHPRDVDERFAERAEQPRMRARKTGLHNAERYQVFAPCPQGLEDVLTIELRALGYEDARVGRAGAHFSTDWQGVQRANLYSRLATRILVQVAQGPVQEENDLLDLAYATPWERWFGAEQTLRVDTSAIKSPMRSLQYCNLRVKDGICDRLMDREGARPDIDTVRPDARVHAFLTADTATLYLDTSGESLFKRGWRLDKGEAPLRENLAAGMLALAGWDPAAPLLDPFCGSGTILIEAAWIALGVPPGIARPFSFERLRDHEARRWHDMKDDARAHIQPRLETPLFGYDIDPTAIDHARRNAERAWLTEDAIQFEVGDARTLMAPAETGWIVTNPPYGERMQAGHDESLWRDWSACLKRQFAGWQVHAISSDMTLPQQMRLKPLRRIPLHNGSLDCRLFGFELVSASYRDKRAERHAHDDAHGDEGHDPHDPDDNEDA